ncbi:hypothetical protein, partial [uncultured Flavobacterium sp.]|uniref:hypothetical protein n=1 Tax=uncultured Flavobacterium sp. TaxID=165435 RepID=UPI0025971223
AGGGNLADYLTQLQTTIQTKPEYIRQQEMKAQELSDTGKILLQERLSSARDIRNFEQQKEIALLNQDLERQNFLFELENDPEKRVKLLELEEKINANKSLYDML